MPKRLTWKQVLNIKKNYIGGDIQTDEGGLGVYRGRINDVCEMDGMIRIELDWMAQLEEMGRWRLYKTRCAVSALETMVVFNLHEDGLLTFNLPRLGAVTVTPYWMPKLEHSTLLPKRRECV